MHITQDTVLITSYIAGHRPTGHMLQDSEQHIVQGWVLRSNTPVQSSIHNPPIESLCLVLALALRNTCVLYEITCISFATCRHLPTLPNGKSSPASATHISSSWATPLCRKDCGITEMLDPAGEGFRSQVSICELFLQLNVGSVGGRVYQVYLKTIPVIL